MTEENVEQTIVQLKAELAQLQRELDKAQDENAALREQLEAEWCERKMSELKASRIITEELERLGREILKTGHRDLFEMWAQTLPERQLPKTERIGEPENNADEDMDFAETFEGERALMARAKQVAREQKIPLSQALNQVAGKLWR